MPTAASGFQPIRLMCGSDSIWLAIGAISNNVEVWGFCGGWAADSQSPAKRVSGNPVEPYIIFFGVYPSLKCRVEFLHLGKIHKTFKHRILLVGKSPKRLTIPEVLFATGGV
jgi:hypothetical protein